MKKVLAIAAVAAMVPCAAFAKSTISDSDMGKVTGQAGVSINMDVSMDIHMDTAAWGDSDGLANATTSGGWIGMKNFDASGIRVRLRQDLLQAASMGLVAANSGGAINLADGVSAAEAAALNATLGLSLTAADYNALLPIAATASAEIKPLTIDVATAAAGDTKPLGTTYVRIGLGSMQIDMAEMKFDVALGASKTNLDQVMGSFNMTGLNMLINKSSNVDIYATSTTSQGVVLDFDVTIDKLKLASMSWGDADGSSISANTTGAGYIGYANMAIDTLKLKGPISINVASLNGGTTIASPTDVMYLAYPTHQMGNTFVHIGFGSGVAGGASTISNAATTTFASDAFGVSMKSFDADVKVGSTNALGGGTLGSIYASNFMFGVKGWVDIAAH